MTCTDGAPVTFMVAGAPFVCHNPWCRDCATGDPPDGGRRRRRQAREGPPHAGRLGAGFGLQLDLAIHDVGIQEMMKRSALTNEVFRTP